MKPSNIKLDGSDDSLLLRYIIKDKKYIEYTLHEMKQMRANMITSGTASAYDLALIQYNIMKKEDRLPWANPQ